MYLILRSRALLFKKINNFSSRAPKSDSLNGLISWHQGRDAYDDEAFPRKAPQETCQLSDPWRTQQVASHPLRPPTQSGRSDAASETHRDRELEGGERLHNAYNFELMSKWMGQGRTKVLHDVTRSS